MDSIADMFVRMMNAIRSREETVDLPHSRIKEQIARILQAEGYISKYDILTRINKGCLRLWLKYTEKKKSVIEKMKRVSTPGRRVYVGCRALPRIRSGYGTAIISTPKGLMTDGEAREKKLGGEVIGYVW
jgi:small subunit ribosomal protein S8